MNKPEQSELFAENIDAKTNDAITLVMEATLDKLDQLGIKSLVLGIMMPDGHMARTIIGETFVANGIIETLKIEARCQTVAAINKKPTKKKDND
jgi:hypothetical protein